MWDRKLDISNVTEKEKLVYDAFKDFHQWYLDSGGKPAELSDIILSIMDKAYPPVPPEALIQAFSREVLIKQIQGWSSLLP